MSANIYDPITKTLIPYAGESSGGGVSKLSKLSDVSLSSLSDGQTLTYDATNKVWINSDGGTVVIDELEDIGDVDLTNLTDGQVIMWNATNSTWVNASLPTKVSDLINDSGYITSASVPTKTSDLTNDSGFITSASIPTKTSDLTNDSGYITSADVGVTGVKGSAETSYRTGNVEITKENVGLGNVGNFKAVSTVASQGLTDTEKSNARANIGAGTSSLALGTSSSTAYRGDYGNSAYAHAVTNKGSAFASGLYKITTNSEGHVTAATAVAKADITGLGIPASDTNNAVTQTATTTSADYEVLFSSTADNTTRTEGARKNSNLKFNPSTGNLQATQLNGVTIGTAPKFTDTDTKVTSVGNHYAPAADTSATLSADASSSTAATWGSTDLVTGVNLQRDAKGHVTGVTVDSIQMPANPNTDTIPSAYCSTAAATAAKVASCSGYALLSKSFLHVIITTANTSQTALTLNVNSKGAKPIYINGSASSTSNYTLPAGSYLVYYNGTNYYFRTDGKITGSITGDAATVNGKTVGVNVPADAKFTDTTYSVVSTSANGLAPKVTDTSKFLKGDGTWATPTDTDTKNTAGSTDTSSKIYLVGATSQAANPQTYSDNEVFTTSGVLSSKKVSTKALVALTGSGTAGSDKGSGVSPRYIPSLWTFNAGVTVANGEVYFIKIPVAGGTYGVWLSLNNGTNYYPVAVSSGKARFTTHYAKDTVIGVTYESAGVCTCYAKAGADATADVTGIFRVFDSYDTNTTYSAMSTSELTTGTATTLRTVRADYLKAGITSIVNSLVSVPTVLSATLAANATSVSFTNAAISTTAMIDVYTSVPNLSYTNMAISGTTLTLTYPKQSAAVTVKLVITT